MSTKCEICHVNEHKYKCPRCELKTCSLECCKKHKVDTNCDGKREKTKFLKMGEFTERDLLNDYQFLEEQSRLIDSTQRDPVVHEPTFSSQSTGFYENLRKFVYSEFGINLRLMPVQSSRHQANKSRFNRAMKMVSWSIEFAFHLDATPDSKSPNLTKFNTRTTIFSSNESLRANLIKFYQKFKSDLFEQSDKSSNNASALVSLYTSFNSIFQNEQFDKLNILFQVNDFANKRKYYVKFDLDKSLGELLEKRTIIEYPTFYVVKNENLNEYTMCDEKAEDSNATKQAEKMKDEKSEDKEEGECEEEEDEHYLNPLLDPAKKDKPAQSKKIKLSEKEIEEGEALSDSD